MPKDPGRNPVSSHIASVHSDSRLMNPARIYEFPQETPCLDSTGLAKLERAFRSWASLSRSDVHVSRRRLLMIFLLIRYTGARLNEVLALDLRKDIHMSGRVVRYGNSVEAVDTASREVQISAELVCEIHLILDGSDL